MRNIPYSFGHRKDTLAHAICGGYWHLYTQQAGRAVNFFEGVRQLPYGEEVYRTALALKVMTEAKTYEQIYKLAEKVEWPIDVNGPNLRLDVVRTLERLRLISQEAAQAQRSLSTLARSAALNRASGELTKLQQELDKVCPLPERNVIRAIIEQWRDPLALAGGEIGEIVLREPIKNPYVGFGGQPVVGEAFIGRENILAKIETLWTNPGSLPSLFVYGHRRMGKTSILRNLNRRHDPKTVLVLLDMQNAGSVDDTAQFYYEIGLEVYERTHQAGWLTVEDKPDEAGFNSMGLARRSLNILFSRLETTREQGAQRLIIAIDEFELIQERIRDGRIESEALNYLRSLTQKYNWLALIFGGLLTLEEMGKDYKAAFYGSSESIRVSYLSKTEAEKLICQPDPEFLLEYEPALVDELYHLTNGQPFLLQRLCWELVNTWNERFLSGGLSTERVLKLSDLETLMTDQFYQAADYYFSGVWGQVGPDERKVMRVLAQTGEQGLTVLELQQQLPQLENIADVIKKLKHRDVVSHNPTTDQIRFAAELNRRWVNRTQID
ncbi:MAG: ATP-binding protein [Chloroflexota bacterium]|nr:ATP-binding protein [Chloroflexota bacterium]